MMKREAQLQTMLRESLLSSRPDHSKVHLNFDSTSKPDFPIEPTGQPQPDERITQAEYEKVVKGARLTDPVEEPISRSCTMPIISFCQTLNKPRLYACDYHVHSVDDDSKESSMFLSKLYFNRRSVAKCEEHPHERRAGHVVFVERTDTHLQGRKTVLQDTQLLQRS